MVSMIISNNYAKPLPVYLANFVEVVEDVGWVGHSYPQPASVWYDFHQFPEEVREGDPDVPAVGAGVLGRQPDLNHPLLEALHGTVHNLFNRVATQLAPGMFGLDQIKSNYCMLCQSGRIEKILQFK